MSAADPVFVDTNVILYWLAFQDRRKNRLASEWMDLLWNSGAGRISWQVIHEAYSNATRKLGVPKAHARALVEVLSEWRMPEMSLEMIRRAWRWSDTAHVPYWDGLILGAAEQCRCKWLLSEDFQDGRKYGALIAIDPFRHAPTEFGIA